MGAVWIAPEEIAMNWDRYDTPMGPAGYLVTDVCANDVCQVLIDRGLFYLCGAKPGQESAFGCGRWFCGQHLFQITNDLALCDGCKAARIEELRVPAGQGTARWTSSRRNR
jgi:hypothetical protein